MPANLSDEVAMLRARVVELEQAQREQREAEQALRESRARLRTVVANAPIVLFAMNRDGVITVSEGRGLEALGLKPGEVVGRSVFEAFGSVPQIVAACRRGLNGESFTEQIELEPAAFETRFTPLWDANGDVAGVIGVATDISDRLRAEKLLRASEERFRLLAENVPGVIYLCRNDARFTMLYLNDGVERLTGYSKTEFLEDKISFADLFHPDDADSVYKGVNEAIATGRPFHLIYRMRCRGGQVIWAEEFGVGVFRDGRLAFLEGYITDITQRVYDQHALEESKADLERRVAERTEHLRIANEKARRMQDELAQVLRVATVGEMATGLAHELNQPLSAIVNYIEGIKRRVEAQTLAPDELVQTLDKVAVQSQRAASILRTVRRYIGRRVAVGTECDVNDVVREAVELAELDLRQGHVRVELSLAADLPHVICDTVQVEQVLLNLIRNGIEAMQPLPPVQRWLQVTTRRCGADEVETIIRDSGPGLPAEMASRIFEPFVSTKPRGLGMGLSISRSIIEAHQGRIWSAAVDDAGASPAGAEFHFTLPIRRNDP